MTTTDKRNSNGVKDSVDIYRQGGKFTSWAYNYPKDLKHPEETYAIETKEERLEALEFFRQDDPRREYKAVKINGFYEILATEPL